LMVCTVLATRVDSRESAIMRRLKHRSLFVETLEAKVVLSSAAAGHLELSRAVRADVAKVDKTLASEGMITGSADAFGVGIEMTGGTGSIRPLGSVRVSSGVSAYMFLRNPEGAITARVAVGFVDLDKPKGHQWVAELTLEAPRTNTTYRNTDTVDYALQLWNPATQPGEPGSFGSVIRSGTGTLRFPDGLPTTGEPPVPFIMILGASH
jgi:hypothetical protein